VYTTYSNGPNTEPCGTPNGSGCVAASWLLYAICCVLSDKNVRIHSSTASVRPKSSRIESLQKKVVVDTEGRGRGIVFGMMFSALGNESFCIAHYPRAPRSVTDKLQRVLNAAARLSANSIVVCHVCCTPTCTVLHWLDVPERVQYKLGVTVRRCQQHKAPQYLTDCVTSASDIAGR